MKTAVFLFAVLLSAAGVSGQDFPAAAARNPEFFLAQNASAAGERAAGPNRNRIPEDSTVIKAPAATSGKGDAAGGAGLPDHSPGLDPVKLWTLIASGGWAMIPLGFLSVLTGMLVIVYLFTLRRSSIVTAHYMGTADVLLKKRDYLGLLAISNRHSEAVARVVQRTLDFATKNPGASFETVKEIAQTEGQSQAASLQHRTVYLADIGMLAPMIGLLGTVLGIIRSFGVLGSGQATASRDVLLASGVSEALVATAVGLVLGILAMGFYSIFRNKAQSLISDLESASAHVLGLIAVNYHKRRDPARDLSRVQTDDEF